MSRPDSLRWYYPDQVKGYDLSSAHNKLRAKHPISQKKSNEFLWIDKQIEHFTL